MNYGLSENITFGGGVEYLSSVTSGNTMPFLNTSVRLSSRMLFTGEYTYGVRSRALLNYRLPAGIQLDLDYTNYTKGQTAIYYNYLEERKVVITMPLSAKGISLFSRLTLDQVVVPQTKYTNAEWVITGFVHRLGFNISTYSSIVEYNIPYIYSILGLTIPIPGRIIFSPQVQYDYKENKPVFMKFIFEKRVSDKGLASVQFQDYFSNGNYNFLVGLRYDLSAVKLALSVLQGNNNTYSRVEAASGSLVMDSKSKYFNLNNRSNVGRGGVFIEPFLDLNNNGQKDPGEPKVPGLKIRVNGGRIFYNEKDTTIRIIDLEPYNNYIIELERNSFDNISWQIKNKILSVTANPNNFTYLEVPVRVVGEVSGTVSLNGRDGRGQGQILINVFDSSGLAAKVITESDGFYSYLGLAPGSYTVRVDSTQLHNLHLKAQPAFATVKIAGNRDGDVADGLDFILQPVAKDTTVGRVTAQDTGPESSKIPVEPRIIGEKGSYTILVDVYDNITTAGIVKTWLTRKIVNPVTIVQTGDDYKVEITGFPKKEDASRFLPIVENLGFRGPLIIRLKENIMR